MKSPLCLFVLTACASSLFAAPQVPIYEENFNVPSGRLRLLNGAALGGPGTGVSGKVGDCAYLATPKTGEQDPAGPVAVALKPIAPDPLKSFTCCFWYLLDEQTPDVQIPVATSGVVFLLGRKGFEVRVGTPKDAPRPNTFFPGQRGPVADWTEPGHWIFAAFTWEQEYNRLTVHQGTADAAVTFMRDMARDLPTGPALPRTNLDREPETLGNTHSLKYDRPLAGRLDNFRFYDQVITRDELEQIRRADLEGRPVVLR